MPLDLGIAIGAILKLRLERLRKTPRHCLYVRARIHFLFFLPSLPSRICIRLPACLCSPPPAPPRERTLAGRSPRLVPLLLSPDPGVPRSLFCPDRLWDRPSPQTRQACSGGDVRAECPLVHAPPHPPGTGVARASTGRTSPPV